MKGKLGIAVGLAAGYVLGTRAGRERYQQLTASAKRIADEPSLQRLQEELNGLFGSSGQAMRASSSTCPTATGSDCSGAAGSRLRI